MTSDFDLLDVDEGAGFCHVKPTTMRAWILQSRVPYVKLGRRVFLRRQDLEKLIPTASSLLGNQAAVYWSRRVGESAGSNKPIW